MDSGHGSNNNIHLGRTARTVGVGGSKAALTDGAIRKKERDDRGDTIPEWDGKSFSLNVYKRKVRLYEASSQTPASRRGCKLLQKLTGDAFDKTEHLDPNTLVHEDGVARLLSYLEAKYEPKEAVKVGSAIDEFIERLERRPGEEIRDFDTRFESKMKEL